MPAKNPLPIIQTISNGSSEKHAQKNKPYKFIICDKSFTTNGYFKKHVASVHEGKKPHKCTICETSFTETGNLRKKYIASVTVHRKQKPHKFTVCDTKFTTYK